MANININNLLISAGIGNTSGTYDSTDGARGKFTAAYTGETFNPDKDQKLIFGHEDITGKLFYANGVLYDIWGQRIRSAKTTGTIVDAHVETSKNITMEDGNSITTDYFKYGVTGPLTIGLMDGSIGEDPDGWVGDGVRFGLNIAPLSAYGIESEAESYLATAEDGGGLMIKHLDIAGDSTTLTDIATIASITTTLGDLNVDTQQAVVYTEATDTTGAKLAFKGIKEVNGKIAQGNGDIELQFAKVATTGEAVDVKTSTIEGAEYDVTASEISADWIQVVEANELADTDDVETSLEKVDTKIAGLADELIRDEQVIISTFSAVRTAMGAESDFSMDFSNLTDETAQAATNIKDAIKAVEDEIIKTTIDGHKGDITTGNGLTDVTADDGSFAVKAKTGGYISVTADGVDIDSAKIDTTGGDTVDGANLTTHDAVNTMITAKIEGLDVAAQTVVAMNSGNTKLQGATISETDGKIAAGTLTDLVEFNQALSNNNKAATMADVNGARTTVSGTGAIEANSTTTDTHTNYEVSLKINSNDQVLSQDTNGLLANISMEYSSTDKKIYLYGKTTEGTTRANLGIVDCTDFIKDGMIDTVAWKKDAEGHDTNILVITWNTEAGKTAIEIDMSKLIDIYTADEEYLHMNDHKIEHKTSGVTPGSYGTASASTATYGGTISLPYITVDAAGHTKAAQTIVVTLPAAQTITGETALENSDKTLVNVAVAATSADSVNYEITSTVNVKTHNIADATADTDGLATAKAVKDYVTSQVPQAATVTQINGTQDLITQGTATSTGANLSIANGDDDKVLTGKDIAKIKAYVDDQVATLWKTITL